jgi:hypothetical protein
MRRGAFELGDDVIAAVGARITAPAAPEQNHPRRTNAINDRLYQAFEERIPGQWMLKDR